MSRAQQCKVAAISEEQLQSWKLLEEFRRLLKKHAPVSTPTHVKKGRPKRLLHEEDYLSAFLFAQFNPILSSMRGLCAASHLEKVQDEVCSRSMSLGSFSEAQHVFGFERLESLFEHLVHEKIQSKTDNSIPRHLQQALRLVDSSVFQALPRMSWAHWRSQYGKDQSAIRLHLKFHLLDQKPAGARITPAKRCERKAMEEMIKPDEFYVGDRYYGRDYRFLERLNEAGCSYLIRVREDTAFSVIEQWELSEDDRTAGVVSDEIVRLGARERWHLEPIRLLRIEKAELEEPLLLVTNHLDAEQLSANMLADIYRRRWDIELFFRWLKCLFGRRRQWHWFAQSAEGVGIQLYSALIASLLLSRRLGKLPNKRVFEALQWHQAGLASAQELSAMLEKALPKKKK